jgi:hypothetical protein
MDDYRRTLVSILVSVAGRQSGDVGCSVACLGNLYEVVADETKLATVAQLATLGSIDALLLKQWFKHKKQNLTFWDYQSAHLG